MLDRTACALLAVFLAHPAAAQERVDDAMIARIRSEALDRSQAVQLYGHLTDVIGPRLAGTPAYRSAADWARSTFEQWGLANAHLEAFEFGRGWTLEKLTLEMTAPRYFPLTGYPEAWSPSGEYFMVTVGFDRVDIYRAADMQIVKQWEMEDSNNFPVQGFINDHVAYEFGNHSRLTFQTW